MNNKRDVSPLHCTKCCGEETNKNKTKETKNEKKEKKFGTRTRYVWWRFDDDDVVVYGSSSTYGRMWLTKNSIFSLIYSLNAIIFFFVCMSPLNFHFVYSFGTAHILFPQAQHLFITHFVIPRFRVDQCYSTTFMWFMCRVLYVQWASIQVNGVIHKFWFICCCPPKYKQQRERNQISHFTKV